MGFKVADMADLSRKRVVRNQKLLPVVLIDAGPSGTPRASPVKFPRSFAGLESPG
jgi:hypothetical protein